MAKKKEDPGSHMRFFNEKSEDIFTQESVENVGEPKDKESKKPSIIEFEVQEEGQVKSHWKELRKFFVTGSPKHRSANKWKPLGLKNLFQGAHSRIPSNYPLWLSDEIMDNGEEVTCEPLSSLIDHSIKEFAPKSNQAEILKMYTPALLTEVNQQIGNTNKTIPIQTCLEESIKNILSKYDIKGPEGETFKDDLHKLKSKLPTSGVLIAYSQLAVFNLLSSVLNRLSREREKNIVAKIAEIANHLQEILKIEEENYPSETTGQEHLSSSLGNAADYFDTEKLSSLLPESASEHMPDERIKRIGELFSKLDKIKAGLKRDSTIILEDRFLSTKNTIWQTTFAGSELAITKRGTLCSEGINIFSKKIESYEELVRAFRVGKLEVEGKYNHEQQGDFFNTLNWKSFSEEELQAFPPIIIFINAELLDKEELESYTRILSTGIPINIIAIRELNNDSSTSEDILRNSQEPSTLAMAYRNTYVAQNTSLSPQELYQNFSNGIHSSSSSLYHLLLEPSSKDHRSLLKLSTTVESRTFPNFVYNGNYHYQWGNRFSVTQNPQPGKDWTEVKIVILDENKEEVELKISITHADFLSLYSGTSAYFRVVPPEFWSEELIELSDFIGLADEERYSKIPFIWVVDDDNHVSKAAVSWNVVLGSFDRLDFWRYLQEVGGINNFHAKRAVHEAREQIMAESEQELKKAQEEHEKELERVRKETANEAMERLTSALLDLDPDSIISKNNVSLSSEPSQDTIQESEENVVENVSLDDQEEIVDELVATEPWIETPLCTTCNECTDINNRMFKYNGDRLAYIADPKAGTFAELVKAAGKCPVKIIHPGQPLDPKEPGLDELIKIAADFN